MLKRSFEFSFVSRSKNTGTGMFNIQTFAYPILLLYRNVDPAKGIPVMYTGAAEFTLTDSNFLLSASFLALSKVNSGRRIGVIKTSSSKAYVQIEIYPGSDARMQPK